MEVCRNGGDFGIERDSVRLGLVYGDGETVFHDVQARDVHYLCRDCLLLLIRFFKFGFFCDFNGIALRSDHGTKPKSGDIWPFLCYKPRLGDCCEPRWRITYLHDLYPNITILETFLGFRRRRDSSARRPDNSPFLKAISRRPSASEQEGCG